MPIRWVFVRDRDGTHRDEYFFTTDPAMTAAAIIGDYTGRWNIETTFQELRCLSRPGDDAGVVPQDGAAGGPVPVRAVLRWWRCCTRPARVEAVGAGGVAGKTGVTFSDALTAVRRWLWREWVFPQAGVDAVVQKLPEPVQDPALRPCTGGVAHTIRISRANKL